MRFSYLLAALAFTLAASSADAQTQGTLAEGDATLESGEYEDTYEVRAQAGQWIRAIVRTQAFDPYLIIVSPDESQTDVDDSEEGNTTMTEAVVPVDQSGVWSVVVTSYAPGESGAYTLTYEVLDREPVREHQ